MTSHVAVTYGGSDLRLYLNGTLDAAFVVSGLQEPVGGGTFGLGQNLSNFADQFNGRIDEVRIWNVARTQAQIAGNMGAEIPVQPNLVGYWRLNCDGIELAAGNTLTGNGNTSFQPGQFSIRRHRNTTAQCLPIQGASAGARATGDDGSGSESFAGNAVESEETSPNHLSATRATSRS